MRTKYPSMVSSIAIVAVGEVTWPGWLREEVLGAGSCIVVFLTTKKCLASVVFPARLASKRRLQEDDRSPVHRDSGHARDTAGNQVRQDSSF